MHYFVKKNIFLLFFLSIFIKLFFLSEVCGNKLFLKHRTILIPERSEKSKILSTSPNNTMLWLINYKKGRESYLKETFNVLGCKLLDYIPDNGFLLFGDKKQLRNLTKKNSDIYWFAPLLPSDKLSNSIFNSIKGLKRKKNYRVNLIVPLAFNFKKLQEKIHQIPSIKIIKSKKNEPFRKIELNIDNSNYIKCIIQLSCFPESVYIEPTSNYKPANADSAWVIQSWDSVNEALPIWSEGLNGEGQIVGVCDTGVDVDNCQFYDEQQGIPNSIVNLSQRKIIAYFDLAGNNDWDSHHLTHGTHVAGSIAGDNFAGNGTRFPEFPEYNNGDGMGLATKLVVQDAADGDNLSAIPLDLTDLFRQANEAGADIHSDSWGNPDNHEYSSGSRDIDQFMWYHQFFQIVFAAGNSGDTPSVIWEPSTAKDCITVGATWYADQANSLYQASSFGPALDGRLKPTVVAPGVNIYSSIGDNHNYISHPGCDYYWSSGTSSATPIISGVLALVRQYFQDGYYPTGIHYVEHGFTPLASLIKAALINSCYPLEYRKVWTKSGWTLIPIAPIFTAEQGWGRPLLDATLSFNSDVKKLMIIQEQQGIRTGEEHQFTVPVFTAGKTLKITLVWSDYPSSLLAGKNLVNNLDLKLQTPDKITYLGNVFDQGVSIPGSQPDAINCEEQIIIPNAIEGNYSLKISGNYVPFGPQPYSVVVSGNLNTNFGRLQLDKRRYFINETGKITLYDANISVKKIPFVTVFSDTEELGEKIFLTEIPLKSSFYTANIRFITGRPVTDGNLQVKQGDAIKVQYIDYNDGTGSSRTITVNAEIDYSYNSVPSISVNLIFLLVILISILLKFLPQSKQTLKNLN